jgi:hypothetical protein
MPLLEIAPGPKPVTALAGLPRLIGTNYNLFTYCISLSIKHTAKYYVHKFVGINGINIFAM